ncbi:MAG TPA: class I SAM-dependent methyltransferase [Paludibacter sp.]|nr:class I SAM-dependent methyltransferase [Paludibacter sp.]
MKVGRFLFSYFKHLVTARNTKGFGVHSPFVYQFIRFVLYEKHYFYAFTGIEALRKELKRDRRIIGIKDFGTGADRFESVGSIVKRSAKPAKYGKLLFRIAHYFKSRQVLELGTSIGLTTSYLATSSSGIQCVTFEGSPEIACVAAENFRTLGLDNITLKIGNINQTLQPCVDSLERLDLLFFDANHTSTAVLAYFETCLSKVHKNTVFILDDIHWSKDMESAWETVKKHSRVTATIDLFELGIVFFNTDLNKKHYKMRY